MTYYLSYRPRTQARVARPLIRAGVFRIAARLLIQAAVLRIAVAILRRTGRLTVARRMKASTINSAKNVAIAFICGIVEWKIHKWVSNATSIIVI